MWYVIIITLLSLGILVTFLSCKNNLKISGNGTINMNPTDTIYTQQEIAKMLAELAKSEPPASLNPGAMCYEIAMPPERAEYVCPVCNEKTIYNSFMVNFINENMYSCREYVKSIKHLELSLDEHEFCRKCTPSEIITPVLILKIKYKNAATERIVRGVNSTDLQLISEFLNGSRTHSDFFGNETPLKDHSDRISEILGIKIHE